MLRNLSSSLGILRLGLASSLAQLLSNSGHSTTQDKRCHLGEKIREYVWQTGGHCPYLGAMIRIIRSAVISGESLRASGERLWQG